MINLEPICARYGHQMIIDNGKFQEQENVVTKALGVLMENGIYAMCIFLLSDKNKKSEYKKEIFTKHLREMWQEPGLDILPEDISDDSTTLLVNVRKITEDLPKTILTRKVTEQALTFARYHAKAEIAVSDERS